jgi:hypothetical protein
MALINNGVNPQYTQDQIKQWQNSSDYKTIGDKFLEAHRTENVNAYDGLQNEATASMAKMFAPVTPPQPNIADMIRQQSESNKASIAAQLQKTRDLAVGGYNQKIGGLQGTYQPLRDAQDFQGAKNIKATNEQMANMGNTNSGDAITAQIQNRVGNENALNSLNQQQQSDKTNFENLIANANNAYNSDLTSSIMGIDAQKLQSLINQSNTDRSYDYQVGRDTVNDTNYNNATAYSHGRDVVADTGYNNGIQTMQGQSNQSQLIGQNLNNDYQTLVNNGYPAQQATAMAQAKANLTGANLQNDYQMLVNAGYPSKQAAEIAQAKAQTAGQLLNNTAQSIQNQYMPQTLQSAISAQNRSNTGGSASGGSSSNTSGGNGTTATKLTANQIKTETSKMAVEQEKNGTGSQWLAANKDEIIAQSGNDFYLTLVNKIKNTDVDYQIAYNIAKAKAAQQNGNVTRE